MTSMATSENLGMPLPTCYINCLLHRPASIELHLFSCASLKLKQLQHVQQKSGEYLATLWYYTVLQQPKKLFTAEGSVPWFSSSYKPTIVSSQVAFAVALLGLLAVVSALPAPEPVADPQHGHGHHGGGNYGGGHYGGGHNGGGHYGGGHGGGHYGGGHGGGHHGGHGNHYG